MQHSFSLPRFGASRTRFWAFRPLPALFHTRPRDVNSVSFSFGFFFHWPPPCGGGVLRYRISLHPFFLDSGYKRFISLAPQASNFRFVEQLFISTLKAFQCHTRIVMAQRKHLDDFLRGRIIGRVECERTQLEESEVLGIAQSVISRLWQ
ncbi:transposable element Tcb1 transposase [Trichonephila clavipes]|uniref:Transposable element Tcb1 transposase n=1 Tax=Trichonephila clavipes TaxID=2585209 RepID=A0A8X6R737_TRICX|nr:transposable element Tcb1 transposase [Trichonephila clavipes]